jgi:methyl-accepting chemotaxis protein
VGYFVLQQQYVALALTLVTLLSTIGLVKLLSPAPKSKPVEETPETNIAKLIADKLTINAVSAAQVSFAIDELKVRATSQLTAVEQIFDSSSTISSTLKESADFALKTSTTAKEMHGMSIEGATGLSSATAEMQLIAAQTSSTLARIENLENQVNQISNVTQVIEDIASQTNLLALNAAIEAARAGEQGRGFAVVADEVRKLAERTATSTDEVGHIVQQILSETNEVVSSITKLSEDVSVGSEKVEEVSHQLEAIAAQATTVEEQVSAISEGVISNEQGLENIASAIDSVKDDLSQSDASLHELQSEGEHLMDIAEQSNAIFAEHYSDSAHRPYYQYVAELAKKVSEKFDSGIESGAISQSDLFDQNYQNIANTSPQKFTTKFDSYCDQILPNLQEPVLKQDSNIVYAIANDLRGYVPTHNQVFTKPLTGDPEKDMLGNRTKRIFDDKVGQRCSAHTNQMLLQTYKRDTGEVMHDISVPVYVQGKHWGSIRMGYKPPHITLS